MFHWHSAAAFLYRLRVNLIISHHPTGRENNAVMGHTLFMIHILCGKSYYIHQNCQQLNDTESKRDPGNGIYIHIPFYAFTIL